MGGSPARCSRGCGRRSHPPGSKESLARSFRRRCPNRSRVPGLRSCDRAPRARVGRSAQIFQRLSQSNALACRLNCWLQQGLGTLMQRLGIAQPAQQINGAGGTLRQSGVKRVHAGLAEHEGRLVPMLSSKWMIAHPRIDGKNVKKDQSKHRCGRRNGVLEWSVSHIVAGLRRPSAHKGAIRMTTRFRVSCFRPFALAVVVALVLTAGLLPAPAQARPPAQGPSFLHSTSTQAIHRGAMASRGLTPSTTSRMRWAALSATLSAAIPSG